MSIRVRNMRCDDIDRVYSIELAAHRAPWSREILFDCVIVGYDCRVLDIDSDSTPLLTSYIISRYQDKVCHILNLCVDPLWQGKGYGQLLLETQLNSLLITDTKEVILEVRPSNRPAVCLYQKLGFQQIGVKRGYYRDIQGIEDAVLLQKILP